MVAGVEAGEGTTYLMRCSTCGEALLNDEDRCPTCGAAVARRRAAQPHRVDLRRDVRQCPRCGYRGDGIPYFRKAGHVGLLIGLSVFTYGIGGLVYYASCRRRQLCPSCGLGWEHAREPGAPYAWEPPAKVSARSKQADTALPARLPPGGLGRRVFGGGLGVLATILITVGIASGIPEPIVVGSISGMAGSGMFLWGWRALQERRQAVLQALNRKVLMLATERGGVLTVTEVAAELNLTLPAAEKIMIGMDDGFRVRSDISKEGVLYYEFPEVRHQKKLRTGDRA